LLNRTKSLNHRGHREFPDQECDSVFFSRIGWGNLAAKERKNSRRQLHTIGARHFSDNESVFDLGTRIKLSRLNTLLFTAGRSLPGSSDGQPHFFMYAGMQFTF